MTWDAPAGVRPSWLCGAHGWVPGIIGRDACPACDAVVEKRRRVLYTEATPSARWQTARKAVRS